MRKLTASAALGCFLGVLLSGCGSGGQDRPVVAATWPAHAQVLPASASAAQIRFDDPVQVLNADAVIARANGLVVPVRLVQPAGDPHALEIIPSTAPGFPLNATIEVTLVQGAVVNSDEHYMLEPFVFSFTTGGPSTFYVGRPGEVLPMDPGSYAVGGAVPTPGGQTPVALLDTSVGGTQRIWVQLEHGDGAGHGLAWFTPGDGAMTIVPLTHGGADLTTPSRSMAVGPNGRFLYAAYRDEASASIRVAQIDLAGATEVASRVLGSLSPSASLRPRGAAVDPERSRLLIAVEDGSSGQLAHVLVPDLAELDRDPGTPGTQAQFLPTGAGSLTVSADRVMVAPTGGNTAALLQIAEAGGESALNQTPGTNVDSLRARDQAMRLQGLAGFSGGLALLVRSVGQTFTVPAAYALSDDVGGAGSGSTAVQALGRHPFEDRFLAITDQDVLTRWTWDGITIMQDDLDAGTAGVQGVDVSGTPGIVTISEAMGARP